MRSTPMLVLAALAALTLSINDAAEARRMGGGGNFGAQRSVTPQRATPAQPAQGNANPATPPAATPAAPQSPTAAGAPKAAPTPTPAAAPTGMSRWLGPIAGIAAGLGLAALLSHFGLSEGFGSLLLLALAVFAGVFLIRMFLGRRTGATAPVEYSAAGAATGSGPYHSGAGAGISVVYADVAHPFTVGARWRSGDRDRRRGSIRRDASLRLRCPRASTPRASPARPSASTSRSSAPTTSPTARRWPTS